MRHMLVILTLLFGLPAEAAIYKCTVNGQTVFSDKPCAADAKEIEVKVYRPDQGAAEEVEARTKRLQEQVKGWKNEQRAADIRREIVKLEWDMRDYQRDMDRELAGLKGQKLRANNNLAGATWEESISIEMQAVTTKYQTKMSIAQKRLEQLRAELAQIEGGAPL